MEFPWNEDNELEELAITGLDKHIYDHLGLLQQARLISHAKLVEDERRCSSIVLLGRAARPFNVQPEAFDRSDLQAFLAKGLKSIKGCWSVYWDSEGLARDEVEVQTDDFRVVVKYRTIQFMVRPRRERDLARPWDNKSHVRRLHIGAGDVKDCVANVLNSYPNEKMSAVIGGGLAIHPDDRKDPKIPRIPFEWKIDRQSPEYLDQRALKWRVTTCGGVELYNKLKSQYELFRLRTGQMDKLPPPGQKPGASLQVYGKRKYRIRNASLESAQSYKRQNQGQQSSTNSSTILRLPSPSNTINPPPITSSSHASTQFSLGDVVSSSTGCSDPTITTNQHPSQKSSTISSSAGFDSANYKVFNVTRGLSGVALTSPARPQESLDLVHRARGQDYGQSGRSFEQQNQSQTQAPKGYGDDVIKSALDHGRGKGNTVGSIGKGAATESKQTMWNASGPQQAAIQAMRLHQPQSLPSAQVTHVSRPWESLSPYEQLQRQAFGSALAQTQTGQRNLVRVDQRQVRVEKQRDEAERRTLEAAQQRLIEADQQRAQEERRRREAERGRGGEASLRPSRGPFPPKVAPQGGRRGLGGSGPQAPDTLYRGYQPGLLDIELEAVGNLATKVKLDSVEGLEAKDHLRIVEHLQKVKDLHRGKALVASDPSHWR